MLSEQLKFDIEHMSLEGLAALREQKCQALEFVEEKRKKNNVQLEDMRKNLDFQRSALSRQELANKFQLADMKKRIEIYAEKLKELEVAEERKKNKCDDLTEQIAYISEKIATY